MNLSVIIPAYNEAKIIGKVLSELEELSFVDEVIVVDDGSSDNTAQIAAEYPKVRVISHPYNMGNGAAIKTGARVASNEFIILMDGDGQHPPAEISKMLPYTSQYEMVVGARTSKSETVWYRNIANRFFNLYASYLVGFPIPDLTSGFRIVRKATFLSFLYLLPNGFSYPTTITIALFRSGYPVKYHPFVSPARVGKSNIKLIRDGLRFLLKITRLGVFFTPLRIFLPISFAVLIPGIGYIIFSLLTEHRFSGLGGLLSTLGLFVFLLGLIAEQIAMLGMVNRQK